MTWEEQRQKLQALMDRYARDWPAFAESVGPAHVAWEFEPDPVHGCRALFCNGAFSHGCYVDAAESGEPEDEAIEGGNGPLVAAEMVHKPQYRHPPCDTCAKGTT